MLITEYLIKLLSIIQEPNVSLEVHFFVVRNSPLGKSINPSSSSFERHHFLPTNVSSKVCVTGCISSSPPQLTRKREIGSNIISSFLIVNLLFYSITILFFTVPSL